MRDRRDATRRERNYISRKLMKNKVSINAIKNFSGMSREI